MRVRILLPFPIYYYSKYSENYFINRVNLNGIPETYFNPAKEQYYIGREPVYCGTDELDLQFKLTFDK